MPSGSRHPRKHPFAHLLLLVFATLGGLFVGAAVIVRILDRAGIPTPPESALLVKAPRWGLLRLSARREPARISTRWDAVAILGVSNPGEGPKSAAPRSRSSALACQSSDQTAQTINSHRSTATTKGASRPNRAASGGTRLVHRVAVISIFGVTVAMFVAWVAFLVYASAWVIGLIP